MILLALQIQPPSQLVFHSYQRMRLRVFFLSFVFGPHLHRQRYQDPPNVSTGAEQRVSFQSLWRPLWSSLCCSAALYRPSPELTLEKSLSGADPYQPLCTPVHMWKMGQHQNIHMCKLTYKYAESAFVGKEGAGSPISGSFLRVGRKKGLTVGSLQFRYIVHVVSCGEVDEELQLLGKAWRSAPVEVLER